MATPQQGDPFDRLALLAGNEEAPSAAPQKYKCTGKDGTCLLGGLIGRTAARQRSPAGISSGLAKKASAATRQFLGWHRALLRNGKNPCTGGVLKITTGCRLWRFSGCPIATTL